MIIYNPASYFTITFGSICWVKDGSGVNDVIEFITSSFPEAERSVMERIIIISEISRPVSMATVFPKLFFFTWS